MEKGRLVKNFIKLIIVISIPILLISMNIQLLLNPFYLKFEYSKDNFPEAEIMSKQERLDLSVKVLEYVKGENGLSTLRKSGLFNEKEISHLKDVRVLVRGLSLVGNLSGLIFIFSILFLTSQNERMGILISNIFTGSLTTLILIVFFLFLSFISFNFLFIKFHEIFFPQGNWTFYLQDSLIQLYPRKFWVDSTLIILILTLIETILLFSGSFFLKQRLKKRKS
jgi:integral membrane protein (TIGR01906 family)